MGFSTADYVRRAALALAAIALSSAGTSPGQAVTILDGDGVVTQAINDGALLDPDTDASPSLFNANALTNHSAGDGLLQNTDSFQLSDVPFFDISGTDYFGFILDVSETPMAKRVVVDQILIGAATMMDLSDAVTIWSLADSIRINSNDPMDLTDTPQAAGGDMILFVPVSLFAGRSADDYLSFQAALSDNDDGDDEWALATFGDASFFPPGAMVPEPGSLLLLGSGILGLALGASARARERRANLKRGS